MASPLRKVSTPLSMWSLRNRLTVGVVFLSALGFIASDIAARTSLHNFLVNQVDGQLTSVAGGSELRLDRAGISPDQTAATQSENDESGDSPSATAKTQSPLRPLRQVPTTMSVTLLDATGNIVGVVGGDLNSQAVSRYIQGFTPAVVLKHKSLPFTIEAQGTEFRVLARLLPSAGQRCCCTVSR